LVIRLVMAASPPLNAGPMTTLCFEASYPKKISRLSVPACELGGCPGSLIRFRRRIELFALVRTNAPNFDSTRRVAAVVAVMTDARSKKSFWNVNPMLTPSSPFP
jgi:hypothetical protein